MAKTVWADILDGGDIGGRSTELDQIAESVREAVYDEFPYAGRAVEMLPHDIDRALADVCLEMRRAKWALHSLARKMQRHGGDRD